MDREITLKVKIKEDENYKRYLETVKEAKIRVEEMKKAGQIDINEVFLLGVSCGMGCKDLNMEVE